MTRKEFEATLTLLGLQEYVIDKHEITWSNTDLVIHLMDTDEISCWHTRTGFRPLKLNYDHGYQQMIDYLTGEEDDPT